MKNKKLLIVISSLVFAAALILCASALFSLADISIVCNGDCSNIDQTELSRELDENLGKSVLFLSKEKIEKKLSEKFPYVKVESMVKSFPNRLKITVSERKEVFAVDSGGKYYILDAEGCLLAVKEQNANNIDGAPNSLIKAEIKSASVGSKVELKDFDIDAALAVADLMNRLSYSNSEIRFTLKKLAVGQNALQIATGYGVTFVIDGYTVRTAEKANVMLAAFNALSDDRKITGKLIVYVNSSGKTEAVHSFD